MLKLRAELPEDISAIRKINQKAFGQPVEGSIVDQLRKNSERFISLVAEKDQQLVGHLLFTPVVIEFSNSCLEGMGLAPMAVLPDFQKQGIGTSLVEEGLKRLIQMDCPYVVVLGHLDYYPRFNFKPASDYGLKCEWPDPYGAFMVLELIPGVLKSVSGLVKYRPEFSQA